MDSEAVAIQYLRKLLEKKRMERADGVLNAPPSKPEGAVDEMPAESGEELAELEALLAAEGGGEKMEEEEELGG